MHTVHSNAAVSKASCVSPEDRATHYCVCVTIMCAPHVQRHMLLSDSNLKAHHTGKNFRKSQLYMLKNALQSSSQAILGLDARPDYQQSMKYMHNSILCTNTLTQKFTLHGKFYLNNMVYVTHSDTCTCTHMYAFQRTKSAPHGLGACILVSRLVGTHDEGAAASRQPRFALELKRVVSHERGRADIGHGHRRARRLPCSHLERRHAHHFGFLDLAHCLLVQLLKDLRTPRITFTCRVSHAHKCPT